LHERLTIRTFATLGLGKSLVDSAAQFLQLDTPQFVSLFHEAERLPNNFTRGVVAARLHLALDELLKLRGQMHVHGQTSTDSTLRIAGLAKSVNVGQCRGSQGKQLRIRIPDAVSASLLARQAYVLKLAGAR
jgi:hypothetical protein